MQPRARFSFWFYMALIGILIVALVYYQGLTSDVNAVGPYLIQIGSLAQGRDPYTGNFSAYPTGATPPVSQNQSPPHGAGPSRGQTSLAGRALGIQRRLWRAA